MDIQSLSSSQSPIVNFVDQLIEKRNFSDLTPELREQLKKDAVEQLDTFILTRILETLSVEDAATLQTLLKDQPSEETLRQFAVDHIPDYTTFMTKLLHEFQERYLE